MKRHLRKLMVLPVAMAAFFLVAAAPASRGGEIDGEEIPFDEADIFFELNNTDGDLGIHALIDGEPWALLKIEADADDEIAGPHRGVSLLIKLNQNFRQQGLTELCFESAEPTFDELSAEEFFLRFPEGDYKVEGRSIEGEKLASTAEVTHLMPGPPENIMVNGMLVPDDCDEGPVPVVSEPFLIEWDEVTLSHPELGRTNEPIEVEHYLVVLEREEPELNFTVLVPSDVTSLTIPAGLTESGDEIKIEILVKEESGNKTAAESCFEVN